MAVILDMLMKNKARLSLLSSGHIVEVDRNHFKECWPEAPDVKRKMVKVLDGPFKQQLGYVLPFVRGNPRDALKVKLKSTGKEIMLYQSQFADWPPVESDRLPGNPARDMSGNAGLPGVRMPMPDLLDIRATKKRESAQSQSSSNIVPEDEDSFRQYLRTMNQSRDHQSEGNSQRPQKGRRF